MITLIFNDETTHPIVADNINYSVSYNPIKGENLRGTLTAGDTLSASMANLSYLGEKDITKLTVQYGESKTQEIIFDGIKLTSIDSYISADSQSASFNMYHTN